jgi:ElaB/YqjD/DUF883 family membrane-anchored ribosome-binding protein
MDRQRYEPSVDPVMPPGQESWNTSSRTFEEQQTENRTQDTTGAMADKAQEKASEMAGQAQEKAGAIADQAQQKADLGMQKTADSLERAAETIRDKTQGQGGTMSAAATNAADALEQGAGYLRATDTEQLLNDLEVIVRQRPVESLLVAAGVGFVLSKALR